MRRRRDAEERGGGPGERPADERILGLVGRLRTGILQRAHVDDAGDLGAAPELGRERAEQGVEPLRGQRPRRVGQDHVRIREPERSDALEHRR